MEEKIKRAPRRSRKAMLLDQLNKLDSKIEEYNAKISSITEQKEQMIAEIKTLEEAEKKAAKEAENKEIIDLIRKKGLSLEEVKNLLENKKEEQE